MHDPDRPKPPIVTPGKTFSLLAPAPSDAVVLFDGKDFSKWKGQKGDVQWKIEENYMETTHTGVIRTKDEFGDFQLHLEFATPAEVKGNGQGRGNNGINIAGMELGRSEKGGNAISFTHVDEAVSKKALDELRALPQIVSATLVKL